MLLILSETCHLKGRDMVTVWRTVLLLSGYYCDNTHQHYDVTQFEYVLWRHTMREWFMNIHYKTWIGQERFTNMILTPSKQWACVINRPGIVPPSGVGVDYPTWKEVRFDHILMILVCHCISLIAHLIFSLLFRYAVDKWFFEILLFLVGGCGHQPYTTRLVRRPAIYTATQS